MTDDRVERKGMNALFLWIPAIITLVNIIFQLIMKLSEKSPNSYTTWTWAIFYMVIIAGASFGLSMIIYLVTSLKDKNPGKKNFNRRAFCDNDIRKEIRDRMGYAIEDFSETQDSSEGSGYFGKSGQDLIYWHLYRILKGTTKRYLLALMNMEVGREDERMFLQSPANFVNLHEVIDNYAEKLTTEQTKYQENQNIFIDQVSGRQEIRKTRTPIMDKPEDEEEEVSQ